MIASQVYRWTQAKRRIPYSYLGNDNRKMEKKNKALIGSLLIVLAVVVILNLKQRSENR